MTITITATPLLTDWRLSGMSMPRKRDKVPLPRANSKRARNPQLAPYLHSAWTVWTHTSLINKVQGHSGLTEIGRVRLVRAIPTSPFHCRPKALEMRLKQKKLGERGQLVEEEGRVFLKPLTSIADSQVVSRGPVTNGNQREAGESREV